MTKGFLGMLLLATAACAGSKYEQQAKDASAKAADAEAKSQALQQQLQKSEMEVATLTKERDELKVLTASLAQEKGAAEAKSQEYENLTQALKKEIAAGQVEVTEMRNKMTLKLKDQILFPSGSAKLSRQGMETLSPVADALKEMTDKSVLVAGHTDNVRVAKGLPFRDNWQLSTERALAVVRFLASKGVPPTMLGAIGFGEQRPVAPNDSKENRSKNRRIEIALTAAGYEPAETTLP